MGRNNPDIFEDKLHLCSALWTPRCLWVSFSKLLWTFRVTSGCWQGFSEVVSVAVSTRKGHWIKFSHQIAFSVLKVVWTTCYPSVRSFCLCFVFVFFFTWSISWSHSWSRLAGQRMFWQECFYRLSLFLCQSVFEHILICKSVSRGRHLNWRLEAFQRKRSELHPE